MFRAYGQQKRVADHVDMSFRDPDGWLAFEQANFALGHILIGDEEAGPAVYLLNFEPNSLLLPGSAHRHASDAWKIALRGEFQAVPEVYKPGDFRLQEGWKVYPGNGRIEYDPDGGWEIVMMADRRGTRFRPAVGSEEDNPEKAMEREIGGKFGLAGDLFSDDPASGAGPSAIASTVGPKPRRGRLNGSFADSESWEAAGPATRIAVSLVGDKEKGPVIVLGDTKAGACAMPRTRFGTETLRVIIDGSCRIGDAVYTKGDMRIQDAGAWCEPVEALDEGLKEAIVIGDRRYLNGEYAGPG